MLELRPHEKSRSARELAFVLASQEVFFKQAAEGAIDRAAFAKHPPPATLNEIVRVLENNHKAVDEALKASEEELNKSIDFAGQTMRRLDALWAGLFDLIHSMAKTLRPRELCRFDPKYPFVGHK